MKLNLTGKSLLFIGLLCNNSFAQNTDSSESFLSDVKNYKKALEETIRRGNHNHKVYFGHYLKGAEELIKETEEDQKREKLEILQRKLGNIEVTSAELRETFNKKDRSWDSVLEDLRTLHLACLALKHDESLDEENTQKLEILMTEIGKDFTTVLQRAEITTTEMLTDTTFMNQLTLLKTKRDRKRLNKIRENQVLSEDALMKLVRCVKNTIKEL